MASSTFERYNKIQKDIELLAQKLSCEEEISSTQSRSIHTVKQKLYDQLSKYQFPLFTKEAYLEWLSLVLTKMRRQNKEKQYHYSQLGLNTFDTLEEDLKSMKKTTSTNNVLKGFDPYRQKYSDPLENENEVKLELFTNQIIKYGDSQYLALAETLSNILTEAERMGYNADQLNQILTLFIASHKPDLLVSANRLKMEKHPKKIFSLLVETLDEAKEKEKISVAKSQLKRDPTEDVSVVADKFRSLTIQGILINKPNIEEKKLQSLADSLTATAITDFITMSCEAAIKKEIKTIESNGSEVSLQRLLRMIQEEEGKNLSSRPTTALLAKKANADSSIAAAIGSSTLSLNNMRSSSRDRGRSEKRGPRFSPRRGSFSRNRTPSGGRSNYSRNQFRNYSQSPRRNFNRSRSSSAPRSPVSYRPKSPMSYQRRSQSPYGQSKSYNRPAYSSSSTGGAGGSDGQNPPPQRTNSGSFRGSSPGQRTQRTRSPSFKSFADKSQYSNVHKNSPNSNRALYCSRCGSNSHKNENCFRYSHDNDRYCGHCYKDKNMKLYHQERYCRFIKSKYSSPKRNLN